MLMLHTGAEPVDFDGLRQVHTPDGTSSHVPIPHHRLVEIVRHMLSFYGHHVTAEHFGITKDGARFFGVLELRSSYGDYTDLLALRNSHDKSFPVALGLGNRVFCCDNMAFIADHVVKRKHTAKAKHELPALISELVEPLADEREKQFLTFERYKAKPITQVTAHHAIVEMFKRDVINITTLPAVLEQWERPAHPWGEETAFRLFNAATFALTGKVLANPTATTTLHEIVGEVCEV